MPAMAILAGGLATRLRPLTETIPKSMIEVNGLPFISWQLHLLRRNNIRKVVICAGYLGEMIEEYVGDGRNFGLEVIFSYDGGQLLGTGGALRKALPLLGEFFMVIYGDSYLDCDHTQVLHAYQNSCRLALMTVFHNKGLWDRSNVEFDQGQIIAYDKQNLTSRMEYIDYGLGVLHRNSFSKSQTDTPLDLAQVYMDLLKKNQLAGYEVKERFYEVGSFQGLEEFKALTKHQTNKPNEIDQTYWLKHRENQK